MLPTAGEGGYLGHQLLPHLVPGQCFLEPFATAFVVADRWQGIHAAHLMHQPSVAVLALQFLAHGGHPCRDLLTCESCRHACNQPDWLFLTPPNGFELSTDCLGGSFWASI